MSILFSAKRIFGVVFILLILSFICVIDVRPVNAATISVNTTEDQNNTDTEHCSLREAITAAETDTVYGGCTAGSGADDSITVPGGIYTIDDQLPSITTTIFINGASAETTIIQASSCNPTQETCENDHEMFWISESGNLNLNNLTLRNGKNTGDLNGGAIYNAGTLGITNSILTNNIGTYGGVIMSSGAVGIIGSTLSANRGDSGGAIYISSTGWLGIGFSTLSANLAYNGGAIYISTAGELDVVSSTFWGNFAAQGGAINSNGNSDIRNSTFSENYAAEDGGAFYNNDDAYVIHCTFSDNISAYGGAGIENTENGWLDLRNAIITNSVGGIDCNNNGDIVEGTNKFVQDGSCDAWFSGDPLLGPLADNGGPTQTHALLIGSPAIDNASLADCEPIDQRGVNRPQGPGCDFGAYEWLPVIPTYLPLILK